MPIENRNLEPGTKLVATYKKETYHALVVASTEGKVLYQLFPHDGKEYKSPSSLGTAVTKKACNGWSFWSVDADSETAPTAEQEGATTPRLPAATPETEPEQPEPEADNPIEEDAVETTYVPLEEDAASQATRPNFRRVPNQRGVDPGQLRLYCDTCHNSFIVPEEQNPETCPMGHLPS